LAGWRNTVLRQDDPSLHNVILSDYTRNRTSQELKRWLEAQGCTFKPAAGGHLKVYLGSRRSVLPMHGEQHQIGKGLENRIKKQLGFK
jgi:mRNA interferase HicA